jgi:Flp pilus assembly protein TadB
MPPKIIIGKGHDKSKRVVSIDTDGRSSTEVNIGDALNESELKASIIDRKASESSKSIDENKVKGKASTAWANGSFFLFALAIIALVVLLLSKQISGVMLSVVIAAIAFLFVLVAIFELRRSDKLKESTFRGLLDGVLDKLATFLKPNKD